MTIEPVRWEILDDEYLYKKYLGDISHGRLVEVGAFNGENWSHTLGLINRGWEALLFEPHPRHAELCRNKFKGNPKVSVEECALGREAAIAKLYECGSLSTIRPEMIDVIRKQGYEISAEKYHTVFVYPMDERLRYLGWKKDFELLVIDVEGAEADVLEGFHVGRWGPHMCIVEACEPCPDEVLTERTEFVKHYFDRARYKLVAQDYIDMVFVRGDLCDGAY